MLADLSLQGGHLAGELVDQIHQGEDERPQLVVLGAVVAGQDLIDQGIQFLGHTRVLPHGGRTVVDFRALSARSCQIGEVRT